MINEENKTMERQDIQVGDEFYFEGNKKCSGFGGTVSKVSRVNMEYDCVYMERFPLHIKTKIADLPGRGAVIRNGVTYKVGWENN